MIPVRLTMKNFICYRDNVPSLDFDGIHVACLCGANGSGKSSIFDAITWALWGEASRGKSNDDLIFAGQNEMEVELEFFAGKKRYRVIRKHLRSSMAKSGQSLLDLQINDGIFFKSISEHTKTTTQDKIQSLLHLDYQTFINSAMILQGRANEFSNKRPGERKEILANILDLSLYDQLEQQSRAYSETKKSESAILEIDIERLVLKLNAKPQLEEASKVILKELEHLEQTLKKVEDDLLGQRKKKEALESRKESLDLLVQQLASKSNELHSWEKRLVESTNSIERFSKILAQTTEIEKGYAKYKEAVSQEETLNEKLKKSLALFHRMDPLEKLITSIQNTYNNERKILSARVTELTAKSSGLANSQQKLSELLVRQANIQKYEDEIEVKRHLLNQITSSISEVSTLNSELYVVVEDIKKKLSLISDAGATCPLCETELGPDGSARIKSKLSLELEQKLTQSKENVAKIAEYKTELATVEKEIRQKEAIIKSERDVTKHQIAVTERDLLEAKAARDELTSKKTTLQKLEEDIKSGNFAHEEQKALALLRQEQNTLGYDAATHKFTTDSKLSLQRFDQLHRDLSDANLQLELQNKTKYDSQTTVDQLCKEIADHANRCSEIEISLAELPTVAKNLQALERQQSALLRTEREIRDRLAESRESLKQISLLAAEKIERERSLLKCREEESIFSELARDFGKKGIQALIIEDSLPEIANEANVLLGKMTDNRMSLALETQRGTKKGDMIETLDIRISDELGTRSYGMYSGGEAFRIDLALRIAISRLLVRRAGASMPILIIDEGFGTQDNAGLEKLIEAINAIKDDFDKVFIITHLEELKERFPVLINITKTPYGSTITLNE